MLDARESERLPVQAQNNYPLPSSAPSTQQQVPGQQQPPPPQLPGQQQWWGNMDQPGQDQNAYIEQLMLHQMAAQMSRGDVGGQGLSPQLSFSQPFPHSFPQPAFPGFQPGLLPPQVSVVYCAACVFALVHKY